jgi:hypothetical protein
MPRPTRPAPAAAAVAKKAPSARRAPARRPAPAKPPAAPALVIATPAALAKEVPAAPPAPMASVPAAPKRKKPKLVRDGFTMPEADYALLGALKKRALRAGHEVKKSELLRAGLRALAAMPDAAYIGALEGVERIKPGRPAAD